MTSVLARDGSLLFASDDVQGVSHSKCAGRRYVAQLNMQTLTLH